MKKSLLIGAAVLGVVSLTACSFEIVGSGNWEITADESDALDAYLGIIDDTLKATSIVATRKETNQTYTDVEKVNGTTSYRETNGNKNWAFVKDNEYYSATLADGDTVGEYAKDKEEYDMNFRTYASDFKNYYVSNATYLYTNKGSDKTENGVTTSEEKITFKSTVGNSYYLVEADLKNSLVTTAKFTSYVSENDETSTYTFTYNFTYDTVTINLPDLTDWTGIVYS